MSAPTMPVIALRGHEGLWMENGPPLHGEYTQFNRNDSKNCKVMAFSADGSQFAFCDGHRVYVVVMSDMSVLLQIAKPATNALEFSPRGTILATWEMYKVRQGQQQGDPNLSIWDIATGTLLRSFIQKKFEGWCPQWSYDEVLCARNVNNELQFFENNNFETIANKLHLQKVATFKLPPKAIGTYHVATYVPGAKASPSFVRLFKYPNFGGQQSALANKSFFKADRVEIIWNIKGTAIVLITASDTSSDSYYGEQGLHYVDIKGESCLVPRDKNGPVYSVEWNPSGKDFCVVYGFMPAKATIYNTKAEPVFDFGTGPRNVVYYNAFGNILCLAGFGNLQGNMEFWDVVNKKLIAQVKAIDSTYFEWSPDGQHVLTSTCAPRLRVGNGYKVWHCSGDVLYEWNTKGEDELWQTTWQPVPENTFSPPQAGAIPTKQDVKPKKYVPPAMRGKPEVKSKYREDDELPSNVRQKEAAQENMSKAALKNKKKRDAKKAKQQQEVTTASAAATMVTQQQQQMAMGGNQADAALDPEVDKKIRNLKKKIRQIEQLREKQASGVTLEVNQIEKLKGEAELVAELEQLQFS